MTGGPGTFLSQDRALDGYFEALLGAAQPEPPAAAEAGAGSAYADGGGVRPEDRTAPAWAEPAFEAALFRVHGLRLAIPTVKGLRVLPYPRSLVPAGAAEPCLAGRFMTARGEVRLVDLGRIVIPERYRPAAVSAPDRGRRVIVVGGGGWSFACDGDVEKVTLEARQVRWATGRSARPWLAGTVMAHACGLLDVEALGARLETGVGKGWHGTCNQAR